MSPRWDLLADRVRRVDELLAVATRAPKCRHIFDQEGALLRDELDEVGLSIADPDTLFAGLVFVELFIERYRRHAFATGQAASVSLAESVRNGLVAAALDHVPAEARR